MRAQDEQILVACYEDIHLGLDRSSQDRIVVRIPAYSVDIGGCLDNFTESPNQVQSPGKLCGRESDHQVLMLLELFHHLFTDNGVEGTVFGTVPDLGRNAVRGESG